MATFEQAGKLSQVIFPSLKNIPDFGIKPIKTQTRDGWELDTKGGQRLLVAALNLILVNEGTRDDWLQSSLITATGKAVELAVARQINRYLIDQGVVNRKANTIQRRDDNGRITELDIWELTPKYSKMLEETPVDVKRTIRTPEMERSTGFQKGIGELGNCRDVLEKADNVGLVFHTDAKSMCRKYLMEINKINDRDKKMSRRQDISKINGVISTHGVNKVFHLTNRLEFRGRMNALGGVISTQGHELLKAIIKFAEAESRVDMQEVFIYAGRELGSKGTMQDAELIGRMGQADGLILQSLTSDPRRTPIKLDGSCNGIQWISSFLGLPEVAKLVNVIGDLPNDFYTEFMTRYGLRDRDQAKKFVMPFGYGASKKTLVKNALLSPRRVDEILNDLYEWAPIEDYFSHLKAFAEMAIDDGVKEFRWVMPDGFEVIQSYESFEVINEGNFSVNIGDAEVLGWKMASALAPNIIHSIDGYFLREVIRKCDFPLITIHDSFGCHSSNVKRLRKILVETFREVIEADLLNNIIRQLGFESDWKTIDPKLITNPYMFM